MPTEAFGYDKKYDSPWLTRRLMYAYDVKRYHEAEIEQTGAHGRTTIYLGADQATVGIVYAFSTQEQLEQAQGTIPEALSLPDGPSVTVFPEVQGKIVALPEKIPSHK